MAGFGRDEVSFDGYESCLGSLGSQESPEVASGFLGVLDDGLGVAVHGDDEGSDDYGKDDGSNEDAADPTASSAGCRLSGGFCGFMALQGSHVLGVAFFAELGLLPHKEASDCGGSDS